VGEPSQVASETPPKTLGAATSVLLLT
jgi:hypothetical protein